MLRLYADSKLHIIKQKHGKRNEPRNVKMNEKTFAAVRGNESLRIECKAQETKQLGDQKRERKTS